MTSGGRSFQLTRVLHILTRLESAPQGLTVAEIHERICDDYEVDRRTVYRDLQALEKLGFAIYPDDEDKSDSGAARWKANRTIRVAKTLNLEYRELIGLYLAKNMLAPLRDTPLYQDLERVFQKVEALLGETSRDCLRDLTQEIRFDPGPKWALGTQSDVIDTLHAACCEKQILNVLYDSLNSGTRRERKLGPQFLYFAKGSLYLVAEDLEARIVKVFSVPRVLDAKLTDDAYEGALVNPETFFDSALNVFRGNTTEHVSIRFRAPMAAYVKERGWHTSQRTVARDDGAVELHLDVAITPELINWILGFGAAAVVMEPSHLREELARTAKVILEQYKS